MSTWEYTIVNSGSIVDFGGYADASRLWEKKDKQGHSSWDSVDKMGAQRWELVSALPITVNGTTTTVTFIFKRPCNQ